MGKPAAGRVKVNRDLKAIPNGKSNDKDAYTPEQTYSGTILYRSTPPRTPETAKNFTQFIFDHRTQRKVVPKASARGGQFPGRTTMNKGGVCAGHYGDKNLED